MATALLLCATCLIGGELLKRLTAGDTGVKVYEGADLFAAASS